MANAYDEAIKVYQDYLPQLQAKYNNILTQLQNELTTAQGIQQGQFGTEKTNLTNAIAKRGLTAKAGSQFFDTEQAKLSGNQAIQSSDLLNKYASLRNETVASQNEDTMGIMASIAGLKKEKKTAKQAQKNWEK